MHDNLLLNLTHNQSVLEQMERRSLVEFAGEYNKNSRAILILFTVTSLAAGKS